MHGYIISDKQTPKLQITTELKTSNFLILVLFHEIIGIFSGKQAIKINSIHQQSENL